MAASLLESAQERSRADRWRARAVAGARRRRGRAGAEMFAAAEVHRGSQAVQVALGLKAEHGTGILWDGGPLGSYMFSHNIFLECAASHSCPGHVCHA